MTRTLVLVAAAASTALALTACGSNGATDTGSAASSTASAPPSTTASVGATTAPVVKPTEPVADPTEPAAEPSTPVAEPTAPETSAAPPRAEPCAEVDREYLITTLRMTGSPKYPLADLEQVRCSGNFASAQTTFEGSLHPVMYLFEYAEQDGNTHWRVIDLGEGLDCVNRHGVPADVGRAIGCGA
ncbi:hypothetical protein IU481_02080 [Nocardia otitidiscaviarum]|nr:hypothetical protein [Nocardia otitidiscaviarum]